MFPFEIQIVFFVNYFVNNVSHNICTHQKWQHFQPQNSQSKTHCIELFFSLLLNISWLIQPLYLQDVLLIQAISVIVPIHKSHNIFKSNFYIFTYSFHIFWPIRTTSTCFTLSWSWYIFIVIQYHETSHIIMQKHDTHLNSVSPGIASIHPVQTASVYLCYFIFGNKLIDMPQTH